MSVVHKYLTITAYTKVSLSGIVLHIAPLIVATKQLEASPQKMSDYYGKVIL